MNRAGLLVAAVLGVGLTVMIACSKSDNEDDRRTARKGEACQTTNDCSPGLACLPQTIGAGICVLGAFSVAPTAKECAIIECKAAADCCPPPPVTCDSDLQLCNADAGAASAAACSRYDAQCKCDTNKRDCENDRCVTKCVQDTECLTSGLRRCVGGKCTQCATDTDCGAPSSNLKCNSGKCQAPCQGDGDCPGFDRCLNGQCSQGGCQTTRECVASTKNVEATCGTDGKCIVPCSTDLECGNPKNYKFFSCVSGKCLYLGCESDKDCRLALESSSSSSTSSSSSSSTGGTGVQQHIVCRDKATPGSTTAPAQ
jgi:hypothetical protein